MNRKITLVLICSMFIAINSFFAQTTNSIAIAANGTYTVPLTETIPADHTARFYALQDTFVDVSSTGATVTFTLTTPGEMGVSISGGSGAEFYIAVGYKLFSNVGNIEHSANAVEIRFGDITPPTITLNTPGTQTIEVGSAYSELGATASDSFNGSIENLTSDIIIDASAVNTNVVASYLVTYNVIDKSGNPASQVTRTVEVVDTTDPVIVLTGPNPQVLEVEDAYIELGATATDNHYGAISPVVIDATAATAGAGTIGSYNVTYNINDVNGRSAPQLTRVVNVVDRTDPTAIAVAGPIDINLNGVTSITPQDVDNGSFDNYLAGGITLSLDKSSFSCDDVVAGQVSTPVTVTLTVKDSSDNTATATVVVNVMYIQQEHLM